MPLPRLMDLLHRKAKNKEAWKALHAKIEAEDRAFTDEEKEQDDAFAEEAAACEALLIEKNREVSRIKGAPGSYQVDHDGNMRWVDHGSGGRIEVGDPGVGRKYADLFGRGGHLSNGNFETFNSFLSSVSTGQHHPDLRAAATEGVPSAGGFLVPEQHAARLLDSSLEDEIVRPRARQEPMTSDSKKIASFANTDNSSNSPYGIAAQWVEESATSTDQEPTVREIALTAHELRLYVAASNAVVADGTTLEQQMGEAMTGSTSWGLDLAFLNGDGSGKPLGVLNAACLIEVAKEAGQPAATIEYDNLTKMFARMHPNGVKNSVWVCNSTAIPMLLNLSVVVGTGGSHIPVLTESNGQFKMLTRPCLFTEKLPALGTKGDIMLCDFSQYVVGLRKEMILETSQHANWHRNQQSFRVVVRADGQPTWSTAFTPKNGDTLSPFIALADRT